jgi:hypothetical protein
MAAKPIRRYRLAIIAAAAVGFFATAAPTLASTGSVYFDNNGNAAAGGTLFNGSFSGCCNVGLGQTVMPSLTTGTDNVATGTGALISDTTGSFNLATGLLALNNATTADDNVATGYQALENNLGGNLNVADGVDTLFNATGSANIALGFAAGLHLTTGSNNIDIGNQGKGGESKVMRIGTQGNQTRTFVAGISGKTVSGAGTPVLVNSHGQLGTASAAKTKPLSAAAGKRLKAQNRRQANEIASLKREVAKLARR